MHRSQEMEELNHLISLHIQETIRVTKPFPNTTSPWKAHQEIQYTP